MTYYRESSSRRKSSKTSPTTFQENARIINNYLKEENLNLNFMGYTKTVLRYFRLQEQDLYGVYQLMIECNLWSSYMADVENFIQYKLLVSQAETDRLCAFVHKKIYDEKLEVDIQNSKSKSKQFSIFHKQVIAQKIFFEKAYWHCYNLYGKGINTLNYKTLD